MTNEVICYPLPKGLEAGELVVVLSFDGSYKVQRGQDVFTISSCNIVGKLVGRENRWEAIIDPKFVFHRRCARLIECLPALQHDPNRL